MFVKVSRNLTQLTTAVPAKGSGNVSYLYGARKLFDESKRRSSQAMIEVKAAVVAQVQPLFSPSFLRPDRHDSFLSG